MAECGVHHVHKIVSRRRVKTRQHLDILWQREQVADLLQKVPLDHRRAVRGQQVLLTGQCLVEALFVGHDLHCIFGRDLHFEI